MLRRHRGQIHHGGVAAVAVATADVQRFLVMRIMGGLVTVDTTGAFGIGLFGGLLQQADQSETTSSNGHAAPAPNGQDDQPVDVAPSPDSSSEKLAEPTAA